ncbi:unnamed protein product, partial [Cyprideis torosa]
MRSAPRRSKPELKRSSAMRGQPQDRGVPMTFKLVDPEHGLEEDFIGWTMDLRNPTEVQSIGYLFPGVQLSSADLCDQKNPSFSRTIGQDPLSPSAQPFASRESFLPWSIRSSVVPTWFRTQGILLLRIDGLHQMGRWRRLLRSEPSSCPGRYEAVSYQLGSERKESCYFVSTDYIKWEDGGDFCARNHNGYLAEFVYQAEWEAFKTFFTNIPDTTKGQLYDTHVWIGAGTTDGKGWRWNGSGADFSQIVPRSQIPELEKTPLFDFPANESYGVAVNVYSGYMEPHRLRSAYCVGYPNMHSYVCETDQPIDKEPLSPSATKCQRDIQDGSR